MAQQQQLKQQLHAQVIPVGGGDVILPNTSIAEIIPYMAPKKLTNAPSWFLGLLAWRGLQIPLISIEAATGGKAVNAAKTSRIAVINAINNDSKFHFFAFLTQGIPHLAKITRDALVSAPPGEKSQNVLANASLAGDRVMVPDIEKLGALIIKTGKF